MSFDFSGPASIVLDSYNRSVALANTAKEEMSGFTDALNASVYAPPTISVSWSSLAPPAVGDVPEMPDVPTIAFNPQGPDPLPIDPLLGADVQVDDFTGVMPPLDFGVAPTLTYGTVPAMPTVGTVSVPDAPSITMPTEPEYLAISTPTFGGVDLHEGWLAKLQTIPEMDLLQPTPLQYQRGPRYASQLLANLQGVINQRIQGGTGLNPAVEQALWDRARDRETQLALANEAEVTRSAEALGFPLPSGALAAQLSDARRTYHEKLSGLSRDIAIKQAELEQENLKQAIGEGIQLESQLMDYAFKLEQQVFEAAKATADNAVQIYNAGLDRYRTLLQSYQAYASTYDTLIKAELTKVEVYKAQLQGEQTKAEINTAKVQQYKATIEALMSGVEIYKAQVSAAQVLVQLEQAKIQVAGEQIRAFVATVSAETAKVEAYKAGVGAETAKVEGFRALVQAYAAKAGAQSEKARVSIARFSALAQAKGMEWDGFRAKVAAESARIDALSRQSAVLVDGYKIGATAVSEKSRLNAVMWESNVKQYEASKNIALQTAKINMDATISTNNARLDAAKAGAQIYAQQLASAYNIVNTSASISGGATMNITQSI